MISPFPEAIKRLGPNEGNRAPRTGKWKIVAAGAGSPWEIYDLDIDRAECRASSTPAIQPAATSFG